MATWVAPRSGSAADRRERHSRRRWSRTSFTTRARYHRRAARIVSRKGNLRRRRTLPGRCRWNNSTHGRRLPIASTVRPQSFPRRPARSCTLGGQQKAQGALHAGIGKSGQLGGDFPPPTGPRCQPWRWPAPHAAWRCATLSSPGSRLVCNGGQRHRRFTTSAARRRDIRPARQSRAAPAAQKRTVAEHRVQHGPRWQSPVRPGRLSRATRSGSKGLGGCEIRIAV